MTPPARMAAAMTVLDAILSGQTAEQALTQWGRANRYAGSGDRHAVRDLVFEALRRKRSLAALGGGMTGRGLILGLVRQRGLEPQQVFDGGPHSAAPPRPEESGHVPIGCEALDCPDWLEPSLRAALGHDFETVMTSLQSRAPTYLRVNSAKATTAQAIAALSAEAIGVEPVEGFDTALLVVDNARKISASQAYLDGLVELQDLSSQAAVLQLPLQDGQRVLDYCAGGGGKSLAMAARAKLRLFAHDHLPRRLKDLPLRAARAGVRVEILTAPDQAAPFDLVLCDVPCSGSGTWRRDPEGKWGLTAEKLSEICGLQAEILDRAARLVQPEGVLAYMTCSVLREENETQVASFCRRNEGWFCETQSRIALTDRGDGFFAATLRRQPVD